jgi:anthranilate synthase/aminodeoxychorismate synthase-like glutamine amidotransferase
MIRQRMVDGRWISEEETRPASLDEALSEISRHEVNVQSSEVYSTPVTPGGFAGLLGYDLGRWSNSVRLAHTPAPGTLLGVLWRCDAWWVEERESGELRLIALEGHDWLDDELPEFAPVEIPGRPESRVPESESDSEHARKVEQIRDSIRGGHLYQVNYGRRWQSEMHGHPWDAFLRMTRSNPAPFASWMNVADHGWAVASASPERLLRLDSGLISTRPIKGTRARGANDAADLALRTELATSPKEMAEHLMLVDLERHDLSAVCEPGSVHWTDCRIEALANVQHLVSGVEGQLSSSTSVGEALSALFPGGSITGCPKVVTMSAIDELEQSPRSAWTGSIGHFNQSAGQADWNILIRTMEARSGPDNWHATVQAGGGVVIDSNPADEVEEARWKAAAVTEATWGFRTGFSSGELPEREVGVLPMPEVEGVLGRIRPSEFQPEQKTNQAHVLLVDNLDSFTNNIAESLHRLGAKVTIVEGRPAQDTDPEAAVDDWLTTYRPTHIILGPGPSRPEASPRSMELARRALAERLNRVNPSEGENPDSPIPLLGWCLGHQALGRAAGWNLIESPLGAVHGEPSIIRHDGSALYQNTPEDAVLMRYNSLVLEQPDSTKTENESKLKVNAWDASGSLVMGITHTSLPIDGVQFHPESVGSPDGQGLLRSFLTTQAIPRTSGSATSKNEQAEQPQR